MGTDHVSDPEPTNPSTDHTLDPELDDPWTTYTLGAIRGGVGASVFIIVILFVYVLLPSNAMTDRAGLLGLIVIASLATVASAFLPWARMLARPHGRTGIYAWALGMVALIDSSIAFTGGARSELYIVLVVMTVFLTGPAFPMAIQVGLNVVNIAGYLITLGATGWGIPASSLILRAGMMGASGLAVGVLSNELGRGIDRQVSERLASESRVALWSGVAAVTRQIAAPDVGRVLAAVVDALDALGLEASDICALDDGGATYRVLHARNLSARYVDEHHDATSGAVGLVLERRRTVVIDDYSAVSGSVDVLRDDGFKTVLAGPVWVDGELAAVLEAGSRERRRLRSEEIAAFELLATQAGQALQNARLLERRRTDAERYRRLLESAPDAVVVSDAASGRILQVSNQAERLFGYNADDLLGKPVASLMPERVRDDQLTMIDHWMNGVGEAVIGLDRTVFALHKDGREIPVEVTFSSLETPQGKPVVSAAIRDVTERRDFERLLAHQATHDQLTGLPNRDLFMQRLARDLHNRLTVDNPITVCLLDLDHFKYVNDSRGHGVGDSLVTAVTDRIVHAMGGHFVARVGGDEFGLLIEGLAGQKEASGFARHLLSVFELPFTVDGADCYVTASIGVAFGSSSDHADVVMRNADAAVNEAKQNGRARIEFFDEGLTAHAAERVATAADLHVALDRNEFHLVYQPVISLDNGQMVGMEALVRWHHPERGVVAPDRFVSIAEDTGLIVPIGYWVLTEACRQLADWRSRQLGLPSISVSVNVSIRQLEHDHFITDVARALRTSQIPPDLLVLEITESFLIRDFDAALRRLHALKDLGVRLSIDDFGTGFSSLFSLSHLPVDFVKIDKSFIDGLGSRYDAVVSAVVSLGNAFDLGVVAEGIEHGGQRDRLIALGCQYAQGYYFSKPLEAPALEAIMQSRVAM